MPCVGVFIIGYGLGLASMVFMWFWLDDMEDGYAGLVIPEEKSTTISWKFRQAEMEYKPKVDVPQRRAGGHLGHIDHKQRQRFISWLDVQQRTNDVLDYTTVPPVNQASDTTR